MLRRKSSLSGGNKKDEAKQKGAHDQGGIPSVPESQDSKGAASEGACGRSPLTSEDKVQTEQSQYTDGCEEPDGSASSRITGGLHTLNKKERKERIERKEAKKREKDKQVREKKEAERQEKERNEREKQKEKERKKMEKQKTRNASQSKQRNSSSQDVQPPVSPNESHLPQEHRNPSEGSQGSQAFTGIEDATLEEGTKQTSSEAQEAMSKKIPPSSKNKKGEPLQMGAHDQGGIPQSPGGTGAASEGACGQSSTTPEDRRHSKQSQHSDGRGEVDDGVSDSSQTSGGRSKSSKRSKKKKKEKEGEQNDGEVEGVAEGQQRTRSTSVFKRFKKTSQGSQPPLSPNENQMPQRRHTHSEGSEGSEIPAIPKKTGFQRNEINVDSLTADLQLEVDLLRLENAVLKQEKCKEITTLKCEKEQEVAKLKEESEKCVAEIREALDQQRQEVERVQAQKQKLENELKTHQDEETARDQKNLAEVKNELEMLQRKFESKQTELGNLNGESESATNKHTNEMEVLKAKHARVLTDLQREKEQTIHEKEGEIELWQRRSKEVEEENAKLHKKLEEKNKVLEGDKDTCTCLLPTELIQQKMKKLTGELEEAQLQLSESRKKLAEKAEEVNRLIHELEEAKVKHAEELEDAKVKHAEELQTELTRKHAEHTEEIDHLKADFEEKRKHDGQYIEQQVEKKLDQREKAGRERCLELKNENEGLKKQLKQKENELKACITSLKGVKEQQLQKKTDKIKSLNEQLNKAKSQQHKVDNELKKLIQELQVRDSDLAKIISEKEAARKAYDKLVSNHKQLQSDYEQLGVMVKLRKHEEASAAATAYWIHSSEDGVESETTLVEVAKLHDEVQQVKSTIKEVQPTVAAMISQNELLIPNQLQHIGDSRSEEKEFHSNEIDHQNKQRHAAREQGGGEYDESHGKHSQPEQIVKFPLSVLNEYGQLQSHSEPQSTEVDPEYREGRITRLERMVAKLHEVKSTNKEPSAAAMISQSEVNVTSRNYVSQTSVPDGQYSCTNPMSQSLKPQPPYRRQASAGPIMIHAIPSISPPLPHGDCYNRQHQTVFVPDDARMTDHLQAFNHKLDGGDEEEDHDDRPFDPNLVCLTCNKRFRIGQIQEYKKHCKFCQKSLRTSERPFQTDRQNYESVIVRGNSAECRTLIDLTSELRLAIRSELISLTGSLLSARLISLDNDDELRNTAHSEIDRSARLVWLIQNKVRQNPHHYHSFIDILQGNQDQFKDILQQLKQTYRKHQHKDGYTRT